MEVSPSRHCLVLPLLIVGAVAGCGSDGVLESDLQPGQPGEHETCAVCGAHVAWCQAWVAQVIFEDGSSAFFDGTRDLFEYLLFRERYLPRKRDLAILAVFVTDYDDQRLIDARTAFYVNGSDVHGPRGLQLVPLESREEAEALLHEYGGARIIRFEHVTPSVLHALGRPERNSAWTSLE